MKKSNKKEIITFPAFKVVKQIYYYPVGINVPVLYEGFGEDSITADKELVEDFVKICNERDLDFYAAKELWELTLKNAK